MEFDIDFSQIDLLELKRFNIALEEINSVLINSSTYYEDNHDFVYVLGYSSKRKFIEIAFRVSKNISFELEALQIRLPYEKDIKKSWCGRGKN